MKKLILALTVIIVVTVACSKRSATPDTSINKPKSESSFSRYATAGIDSPFIPVDTANLMLNSYLSSIGTGDVRSFTVDADALRYYLGNADIKRVKVMFAHKLSYVRSGYAGRPVGYNSDGLTVIISGIDDEDNYTYTPEGTVLDHASNSARGTGTNDQLPPAE